MEVSSDQVIEILAQKVARLTYENAILQAQVAQLQAAPIEVKKPDAETA